MSALGHCETNRHVSAVAALLSRADETGRRIADDSNG
jgi:hypothetical protein